MAQFESQKTVTANKCSKAVKEFLINKQRDHHVPQTACGFQNKLQVSGMAWIFGLTFHNNQDSQYQILSNFKTKLCLKKLHYHCHTAIPILLNSLRVLTAGRTPRKKLGQDWMLTKQAGFILLMNLRGMYSEDLVRLWANTIETLKIFVQSHLISQGSRWMKSKAYVAWSGVQESLTMNLYDMIIELLRIQSRQDTLHQKEMLQAITDPMGDTTQTWGHNCSRL